MQFLRLVTERILLSLLTLLLVSLIIFLMLEILPGDVASRILGRDATPETLAALRLRLHLDEPALLRYGQWLGHLVTGHLIRLYDRESAALAFIRDVVRFGSRQQATQFALWVVDER